MSKMKWNATDTRSSFLIWCILSKCFESRVGKRRNLKLKWSKAICFHVFNNVFIYTSIQMRKMFFFISNRIRSSVRLPINHFWMKLWSCLHEMKCKRTNTFTRYYMFNSNTISFDSGVVRQNPFVISLSRTQTQAKHF